MKPSETEAIYKSAIAAKRIAFQREEAQMWHKALSGYEAQDVRAALDAWWASTATDSKGELKSKWLPAPGELKPLVERVQGKRKVDAMEPKQLVAWRCPDCKSTRCAYISVEDHRPRRCSTCGASMDEVLREAA